MRVILTVLFAFLPFAAASKLTRCIPQSLENCSDDEKTFIVTFMGLDNKEQKDMFIDVSNQIKTGSSHEEINLAYRRLNLAKKNSWS
mmetsp:Transcript_4453/g.4598  ORF Transcript_4453/g.4598 Transcript_4453/m.4598 type:complete len:87 (-) Transcript_4453:78-338(-)